MIDIEILRKKPEVVIESLKKRRDEDKIGWVKKLIELDEKWREKVREDNRLRRRKNELVEEIARRKKEGKGVKVLIRESKGIEIKIEENEKEMRELQKRIEYYLLRMPNILHESVPYGEDESDNVPIRFWGKPLVWKEHLEEFKRQG
ncbi:MAG: serine--tRNA ligase, partial [Nanoarchaeota archaeon]|nr:serine--tRNA ligase [Nanoarchaeota archaeon]